MGQVIRQIGVVIGLTVILTFPVTVVSVAGSHKHVEQSARVADAGQKGAAGTAATEISWPGRQELPR